MIKVAVIGADGRMGATVCQAVKAAPDMELVATLEAQDQINEQSLNGAQVGVDFTIPSVTEANVHACLEAKTSVVVGTTGWDEQSLGRVENHLRKCPQLGVLIAPNFALSAVLAMQFAAQAAAYFESAEIIELHHPAKVDAPSGTALATAQKISAARSVIGLGQCPDATLSDPDGARGAKISGVNVHAVRLRGLVAHEEILFGNDGEQLSIRTDCFDRTSFMPGVLLGIRKTLTRPGLTIGLENLL